MQALTTPAIAVGAAWIALQQMHIARVKLQHDLYDRSYAVFQATRSLLNQIISNKIVSAESFSSFAVGTADAPFLFDDAITRYLKEFRDQAAEHQSINIVMESMPAGDQKAAASREAGERLEWLLEQVDVLTEKFRPFLQLDKRRRSPMRRRYFSSAPIGR